MAAGQQTLQAVAKFARNDPDETTAWGLLQEANLELQNCIAATAIVGPVDTHRAALEYSEAVLQSFRGGSFSDANSARHQRASSEFLKLARRDVGTT